MFLNVRVGVNAYENLCALCACGSHWRPGMALDPLGTERVSSTRVVVVFTTELPCSSFNYS